MRTRHAAGREEPGHGETGLRSNDRSYLAATGCYWQLEAIIFTESTFSFGAFVVELAVVLVPELVALLLEAPP
jgi:hypothetical protein